MKIKPEQLQAKLNQGLEPLYLISGDETLLVDQSSDLIRSHCKQQGFSEREKHSPETKQDWQNILDSANSLSLFGDKKIIDIQSNKINAKTIEPLKSYLESPNPDTVILLSTGKIEAASTRTKWFKTLEEQATFVQIWPLDEKGFMRFIENQCHSQGLSVEPDVLNLIKENTEGNLLAAKQEIEKISLLNLPSPIKVEDLEGAFADASRFTVFHLSEQALAGDLKQTLKILKQLQAEGLEPYLLLWQLTKDIRILSAMLEAKQKGMPPAAIFKQHRILFNKQPFYEIALQRVKTGTINQLLLKARQIDRSIKGLSSENTDLLIIQLITRLCQ